MAQHVLLHSCLLLLDGLRAPGKGVCKCYNSSCSHHFTGTWITEMQCNIKTASKGQDAAATAVFFPSPEMDRNSHHVKYLPLPSPAAQSLPKIDLDALNLPLKLVLLSTHSTDAAPHPAPALLLLSGARSGTLSLLRSGSLEKAAICN